jgi:hypothetical protein
MSLARVHSQPAFGAPDVTTTQLVGGATFESQSWAFLFKLCMSAGSHDVAVTYVFPASAATRLSAPYNMSETTAPWIMLYPESNWQDAYFYIVSAEVASVPAAITASLIVFCRVTAMGA